jgi:uncharacterized membrane protein SirB2
MNSKPKRNKARTWIKKYNDELLIVAGFALILIGSYCVYPVAAWFVGGVEFLIYAYLVAWSNQK